MTLIDSRHIVGRSALDDTDPNYYTKHHVITSSRLYTLANGKPSGCCQWHTLMLDIPVELICTVIVQVHGLR